MYVRLLDELRERWRIEVEAALIGWHMACAMSGDKPPERPDLPDWTDVRRSFDEWLVSEPDDDDEAAVDPEQLDVMIAYGWKD